MLKVGLGQGLKTVFKGIYVSFLAIRTGDYRKRKLTPVLVVWLVSVLGGMAYSLDTAAALTLHKYEPPAITAVPGSAEISGQFQEVNAMTVNEGNLYVTEEFGQVASDFRADEFGPVTLPSLNFVSQLSQSSLLGLVRPDRGVAFGTSTGETEMYLGVGKSPASVAVYGVGPCGSLECADAQGKWTGVHAPGGPFSEVTDVAVDNSSSSGDWARGDVFVVDDDEGNHSYVVDVFKPEAGGKEPSGIEAQLTGISAGTPFGSLAHIAVSGFNGDVVVQEGSTVDVFNPVNPTKTGEKGTYSFAEELEPPNGTFLNNHSGVQAIAVDGGNGELYVATAAAVYEFSPDGTYLGKFTGNETREHTGEEDVWSFETLRPQSLAVDPVSHRLFVGVYEPGGNTAAIDIFGPDVVIPDVVTGIESHPEVESNTHEWDVELAGTVDPDNVGDASCSFAWGLSNSLGKMTPCHETVPNGGARTPVTAELTGLAPGTTYYYRLQASNANGTNSGEEETQAPCEGKESQDGCFTTPGPNLHGESVSEISASSANLEATVSPRGVQTSYHFEYDLKPYEQGEGPHGVSIPLAGVTLGSSLQNIEVSQHIQGLTANTEYNYRVVAVSEVEVAPGRMAEEEFDGPDQTFMTQRTGGSFSLMDGRAWELVSPADKHGGVIMPIGSEAVEQASMGGTAFTYQITAAIESEPQGNTELSQVLAARAQGGGWSSVDIAMPHTAPIGVAVGEGQEYKFFSEDLTIGITEPLGPFSEPESKGLYEATPRASERTPYLRSNTTCRTEPMTCYTPLLTGAEGSGDVLEGVEFGGNPNGRAVGEANFVEATPDAHHAVIRSAVTLTPDPTLGTGLYEWSSENPAKERLQLVSLLPADEGGKAAENAVLGGANPSDLLIARHAISNDGSRIFFSTQGKHQLYMRNTIGDQTIRLDVPEDGTGTEQGDSVYQIAAADGAKAFFTDGRALTKDAGNTKEEGDLYECEIIYVTEGGISTPKCDLSNLTPVPAAGQPGAGEEANVQGAVLGAAEDGSYVYFVADGVQAAGAVPGDCKNGGEPANATCNLYVSHEGHTRFIATLSGDDEPDWSVALKHMTSRVSPNGEWLAFMSDRSLTGYDNADAVSNRPDEEVYLYDAVNDKLVCTSCDPTGARPVGVEYKNLNNGLVGGSRVWEENQWLAANIPGWTQYSLLDSVYQSRYLSNEGRLFFDSNDALVAQDTNGEEDVYEYEPIAVGGITGCLESSLTFDRATDGCVGLISSGASIGESAFLDASGDGSDVFFLTAARLVREDVDSSLDVYDAHECTNDLPCPSTGEPTREECKSASTCRAAPAAQPSIYGAPASATFIGVGNIGVPHAAIVKIKPVTREAKFVMALKVCSKQKIKRRRTSCEQRVRKKYGHSKPPKGSGTKRRASRG